MDSNECAMLHVKLAMCPPCARRGQPDRGRMPASSAFRFTGSPANITITSSAAAAMIWLTRPELVGVGASKLVCRDDAEAHFVAYHDPGGIALLIEPEQTMGLGTDVGASLPLAALEQQIADPKRQTVEQDRVEIGQARRQGRHQVDRFFERGPVGGPLRPVCLDAPGHLLVARLCGGHD